MTGRYVTNQAVYRGVEVVETLVVEAVIRSGYPGSLVGGPPSCSLYLKGLISEEPMSINFRIPCSTVSQYNVDDLFDLIHRPKD
jgi:hypothetical protein